MTVSKKPQAPELLAPVGDLSCLKAALLAGADAVYLAGKRFGARAFASNFDENGLRFARRTTLSLGRKLYITLNTLVFDSEWKLLEEALDFYESLQPDALIIQDLGVAAALSRRRSCIPRHLSTQSAWFGVGGFDELKGLGITRVILPRELSLEEIREVSEKSDLELEVFVHGAMCYSISGRCFWSVALGTRSGNRGTCAQPCRKQYRTGSRGNPFSFFSPRDLRLIGRISELRLLNVAAMKIEGRMKNADYVFHVVSAYRQVIDGLSPTSARQDELDGSFSRTFHEGFLDSIPHGDWTTGENSGREGVTIGRVVAQNSHRGQTAPAQKGLTELWCDIPPASGDGVSWQDGSNRRGDRLTYVEPVRGKACHFMVRGLPEGLPSGTLIRRTSKNESPDWLRGWRKEWERTPVDLFWSGREGQPLSVETTLHGHSAHLSSIDPLSIALGEGLESGPLIVKFNALGEFFIARKQVFSALGKGLFIPLTALKKLKRAVVEILVQMERLPPPPAAPSLPRSPTQAIQNPESICRTAPAPVSVSVPVSAASSAPRPASDAAFALALALASATAPQALLGEDPEPARRVSIRVWNHPFPFIRELHPDCWILPLSDNPAPARLPKEAVRFWLPPILNHAQLDEVSRKLDVMEPQEFLCLGWEAFALRKRFPRHRFRLDWSFNLVNRPSVDLITRAGIAATAGREWPSESSAGLSNLTWVSAWNPLISFSRFPPHIPVKEALENSHKDRFFSLELGNGVTGLFLFEKPAGLVAPANLPWQIDVAVGPGENPAPIATGLEEIIESQRPGNSSARRTLRGKTPSPAT